MGRFRFTISGWMVATAIIGLNLTSVLAIPLGGWDHLFYGAFLMCFALQLGLWRYLRTRGRGRRFWLGFEVFGLAATLALISGEFFPGSLLERLVAWYPGAVSDLCSRYLPAAVDDTLMEYFGGFLMVIHFLPELIAAALGGLLAVCFFKVREERVDAAELMPAGISRTSSSALENQVH